MRVYASLATSLDARITPPNMFQHVDMTSEEDIHRLKELRDQADAIVFGGGSLRAFRGARLGFDRNRQIYQVIITKRSVDISAPIFQRAVPKLIFGSSMKADDFEESENTTFLGLHETAPAEDICARLKSRGCENVLIEGGGRIFQMFLRERLVSELYLTLMGRLFGDKDTPALVQGIGYQLEEAPTLTLSGLRSNKNSEIFLDYKISYP